MQDVLFNALLCGRPRPGADRARAGRGSDTIRKRTRKTARAMNEKLWDEQHGIYLDFDLTTGRPLHVYVALNFVLPTRPYPTKGGRVEWLTPWRARASASGRTPHPVPSYDRYGFASFFPTCYWRGPVWVNIDWLLMRGLERYGYEEQAQRLRETIVSLCRDQASTSTTTQRRLWSWIRPILLDGRLLGRGARKADFREIAPSTHSGEGVLLGEGNQTSDT